MCQQWVLILSILFIKSGLTPLAAQLDIYKVELKLNSINNNREYITTAIDIGVVQAKAEDWEGANTMFQLAEKRARKMSDIQSVNAVRANILEKITLCCAAKGPYVSQTLNQLEKLASADSRSLTKSKVVPILYKINGLIYNQNEHDRLLAVASKYIKDEELIRFKQESPLNRELKKTDTPSGGVTGKTITPDGNLNIEDNPIAATGEVSDLLTIMTDSMSAIIGSQNTRIKSLQVAKMLDSIKVLRKEEVIQNQKSILSIEKKANYRMRLALGTILAGLITILVLWRRTKKYSNIIAEEKVKSEQLLLNILPQNIADELKKFSKVKTQYFEMVTVIFIDFVSFSLISKSMSATALVADLNECFTMIDRIAQRNGIEKIKTIGDAYMAVAGLDNGKEKSVPTAAAFAMEVQKELQQWNADRFKSNLPKYEARIGLHAGPVAAGVVGEHKFSYDIWGETVNIASRVESAGRSNKVSVSKTTIPYLTGAYQAASIGQVFLKNIGEVEIFEILNS